MERDAHSIYLELEAGDKAARARLAAYDGIVKGYTSPFFKGNGGELSESFAGYNPENHNYSYLSFMVSSMAFKRPRMDISSRIWGGEGDAEILRYALDSWVNENTYERHAQKMATDLLIFSAASLCGLADHAFLTMEDGKPSKIPKLTRLSPKQFRRDPGGMSPEECNWFSHRWIVSKAAQIRHAKEHEDEGWDITALTDLPENSGVEDLRQNQSQIPSERDEVVLCEFWDRHHPPIDEENSRDKDFHGVIFTIAMYESTSGSMESKFIRAPRDFYGPESGPYTYTEVYFVPDDPYGLSPCIATEGQNRDLNLHARAMSQSMRNYKRILAVSDSDTAQVVREAPHDFVISLPGVDKSGVVPMEIGGITNQWLTYLQMAKERLERTSGLTEAQRGVVSSGSATAAMIADEASDMRMAYMKQRMHNHAENELAKVAFYIHSSDEVRIPVAPAIAEQMGMELIPGEVPTLNGGQGIPFSLYSMDIEPMSMERSSEGLKQRRLGDLMGQVGNLIPIMQQVPWDGWGILLSLLGEAYNVPGLADLGPPAPVSTQMSTSKASSSSAGLGTAQTNGRHQLAGHQSGAELTAAQRE